MEGVEIFCSCFISGDGGTSLMTVGGVEEDGDDDDVEAFGVNFSCGKLERRDGRILSVIDFDCFDLVPRVAILRAGVLEVEVFDDIV